MTEERPVDSETTAPADHPNASDPAYDRDWPRIGPANGTLPEPPEEDPAAEARY